MSEFLHGRSRTAAAAFAASIALAGCAETSSLPPQIASGPAFERCIDKPLSVHHDKTTDPYAFAKTIDLHYNAHTRHITEMPAATPLADRKLTAGTVKILSGPNEQGSGFVVDGRVITAAHVIGANSLDTVQIQDRSGAKVDVTGGCYVYDNDGAFSSLNDPAIQQYDIAVLQPASALDAKSLTMAKHNPARGDWVRFTNDQLDASPAHPHRYTGLITTSANNPQGITALTGLEPFRSANPADYTVHGGASGGVIGDPQTGTVEGLVYGSTIGNSGENTTCAQPGVVEGMLGVNLNAAATPENGVCPVEANVIGALSIRQVLAATSRN